MSKPTILSFGDGIIIDHTGIRIQRLLSLDDWRACMANTRKVKTTYLGIVADLMDYGRKNFGEDVVAAELEQLEFEMPDIMKASTISLISHDDRAKWGLSSEIAYVIGSLCKTPEERAKWAEICDKENLNAIELKRSIEAGEILRADDIKERSGHGEGIPSIQAIRFQYEKWARNGGDAARILKLPKSERVKILETLNPIVVLAASIEKSLN